MRDRRIVLRRRTMVTVTLLAALALAGCRTAEPPPPVAQPLPPQPAPEPAPDPEPVGHAPLVGPRWIAAYVFGVEDVPRPPVGSVAFSLVGDGALLVARLETGTLRIEARAAADALPETPDDYTREEGSLDLSDISISLPPGDRLRRYSAVAAENLSLVQGYVITGATPEQSRLTIFGGYGREEIILAEFDVDTTSLDRLRGAP